MKPLKDLILIEKEDFTKTKSGLFIPQSADEYNKPNPVGTIIAIGSGCSTDVRVGQKVIYGKNVESVVEYLSEKFYFIRESHIIAEL